MFGKLLGARRADNLQKDSNRGSDPRSAESMEADPRLLARLARQKEADIQGVKEARDKLSTAFQGFLDQLNVAYKLKQSDQRSRIAANYQAWAGFFELIKAEFKAAWNFFGVVEADVEGWHRVAPAGDNSSYLAVGREGYSFAAGIEQNVKRGAPFPKKWLTISLGHSTSYLDGIGDERLVGRTDIPEETLIGLAECKGKNLDEQEVGSEELRRRITQHNIVFTMSSAAAGQHTTALPVSVLEKHSLAELAQQLLVALTNDDLASIAKLLPAAQPLLLPHKR